MTADVRLSDVQLTSIREELREQLFRWTKRLAELEAAVNDDAVEVSAKPDVLADIVSVERNIAVVRAALRNIAELVYGRCEDCGSDIPFERLKARPLAAFCVGCQRRREIR
ncbi:molecular chaperone DnaK [Planobispora rosea]|uniref:Molecular chaperone DnaK n=1 Tax=Planobispora rosea TaxID=35762 RepID=A0A8J3RYR5_PLARO|nr:TraR/DksA family transcriptional regulator [Planobispora rosea]GGS48554.1 molecular chaperone DnaK [Planobispora rosea]GIH83684.1 molecular chaperone DnaK [Planobispora rosea]